MTGGSQSQFLDATTSMSTSASRWKWRVKAESSAAPSHKLGRVLHRSATTRFASINVDTLLQSGRAACIVKEMKRYRIAVAGLQEIRWSGCGELCVDGYKFFFSGRTDNKGTEGVAVCVRSDLVDTVVSYSAISSRIIKVRLAISSKEFLTILSCYAPTDVAEDIDKDEFYSQLHLVLDKVPAHDVLLILGDFNARVGRDRQTCPQVIGAFGIGSITDNGERLLATCSSYELSIMGTWFAHPDIHRHTWTSPDQLHKAQIDHVLVRQHLRRDILDVRSYRGADVSVQAGGHFLLMATMRRRFRSTHTPKRACRLDLKKLSNPVVSEAFQSAVSAKWKPVSTHLWTSVDDEWSMFRDAIKSSATKTIGFTSIKRQAPWIADKTLCLVQKKRDVRLAFLACHESSSAKDSLRSAYSNLCKEVRKACRRDREVWWASKATELEAAMVDGRMRDSFGVLSTLRSKPGRTGSSLRDKTGETLDTPEAIMARWTQHFQEVLKANDDVDLDCSGFWHSSVVVEEVLSERQLELVTSPSYEEVKSAVMSMASRKAAGEDGIVAELLQFPVCISWLERLFRVVWQHRSVPQAWQDAICVPLYKGKGRPDECDNYRGIMLLSVPGKVYARILLRRLAVFAENALSESQNGFRKGRSCTDAIFTLRRLVELTLEQQQQLYLAFVDFTKAYDSVRRERLWEILHDVGLPHEFIVRIAAFHLHTSVRVRLADLFGPEFRTRLGLRQGCVLAPVLFNLYLDHVVRMADKPGGVTMDIVDRRALLLPNSSRCKATGRITVHDTRFADDMTLLATSRDLLQSSLSALFTTGVDQNLLISAKKTKAMSVGAKLDDVVQVGTTSLESVEKFVYLGSEICADGTCHSEVKRRIGMALSAFLSLKLSLWKRREISLKTKLRMLDAFVMSRLLYAAETWTVSATDLARLEAFHVFCLRRILRISWMDKVTNEEVRHWSNQSTLESRLRWKRMKWLGHVERMAWVRLPKMVLWGRLVSGARKPGGQKLRWLDVCTADLKHIKADQSWRDLCQDREEWRKLFLSSPFITPREEARRWRKQQSTAGDTGAISSASAHAVSVPKICSNVREVSLVDVTRRTRRRAADRDELGVVCDICGRHFSREGDKKRHHCVTTRPKH